MKSLNDGSAIEAGRKYRRGISRPHASPHRIYVGDKPHLSYALGQIGSRRGMKISLGSPTEMLRNIARGYAWQRSINPRGIIKRKSRGAFTRAHLRTKNTFAAANTSPRSAPFSVGPLRREEERAAHNAVSLAPRENRRKYRGKRFLSVAPPSNLEIPPPCLYADALST